MKPERWHEVDKILQSVLERAPAERGAYLDQACAGDEQLCREVLTLISSHDQAGSFMMSPAIEGSEDLFENEPKLKQGDSVGPYRIKKALGKGGMGEVYLAEHTGQNREVALKILPPHFLNDTQRVLRFRQEARAVLALNHPQIVTVYDIGEADGVHFISTEFVEGQTLRERMIQSHLAIEESVEIAIQIAGALDYAHERGVIHRDVKPENIMIRPDGHVKVLDFGIAKLTERRADSDSRAGPVHLKFETSPGMVIGTVAYMSPEQLRALPVDERTDVWSLGVVLYEMVAGQTPFAAATAADLTVAILDRTPSPVTDLVANAPKELLSLLDKTLKKKTEERYQTLKEVVIDLKSLKLELDLQSRLARDTGSDASAKSRERDALKPQARSNEASNTAIRNAAATASSVEFIANEIKRRWPVVMITAAILFTALGGLIFYELFGRTHSAAPNEAMKMTRLTSNGHICCTSVSPDGKYVAYAVNEAGKWSLWTRQVANNNPTRIVPPDAIKYGAAGLDGYGGTTFSQDGQWVYYEVYDQDNPDGILYKAPVAGGPPQKILTNVKSPVTFSPDGKQFAFVRNEPDKAVLMIANSDGSDARILATRRGLTSGVDGGPSWSPDGKLIAWADSDATAGWTVFGVSVAGGSRQPLTSHRWMGFLGRAVWLADSSGLILAGVENSSSTGSQLWYISYPQGEARRVTNDLSGYGYQSLGLTADTRTIITILDEYTSNIFIGAFNEDESRARQVMDGKYDGYWGLNWTSDDRIVYVGKMADDRGLWIVNKDGTGNRQLTADGYAERQPVVSPDGRYMVVRSNRSGGTHLWRISMDTGNQQQLTDGSDDDSNPSFSPDGKWVAFQSHRAGKETIWKIPVEGGTPIQLTDKSTYTPLFSPDGKFVSCALYDEQVSPPRNRVMIVPADGGLPARVFDLSTTVDFIEGFWWTPDGHALTYVDTRDNVSNVWSVPLSDGKPAQLTNFKSKQIFYYALSHDGKQFAVARGSGTSDIVLIKDFK